MIIKSKTALAVCEPLLARVIKETITAISNTFILVFVVYYNEDRQQLKLIIVLMKCLLQISRIIFCFLYFFLRDAIKRLDVLVVMFPQVLKE